MNTSKTDNFVTDGYPIVAPTSDHLSGPAVYKVWFGKSFFIWKGKSMLQSIRNLSDSIKRYQKQKKNEPTDQLYHVWNHIKRTRCMEARVEVIESDIFKEGSQVAIDVYRMLKLEQNLLTEAKNSLKCLNNNEQAYIPKWMEIESPIEVRKFLRNWDR